MDPDEALRIYEDNQAVISFVYNPDQFSKMRHVKIKYMWAREVVERKEAELKFIPTQEMTADIFTKPLGKQAHDYHTRSMNLLEDWPNPSTIAVEVESGTANRVETTK